MRAVVQDTYGEVDTLHIVKVDTPKYGDNQILVKMYATNISSGDMKINTLNVPFILRVMMRLVFGFKGPRRKIRGIAGSGEVVGLGKHVSQYQKGDAIYFINSMKAGALAEYIVLNEKAVIAKKPESISYVQAAPIAFGALSAYHFINKKTVKPGSDVLIYGASGSLGTYALQLAKYFGGHVTCVSSEKNHSVLKDLGADFVIDYHKEDFRRQSKNYDLIFDAVMKINRRSCKHILKPNGKYLSVKSPTKESIERLYELNQIIDEGKLISYVEKVYELDAYKQAHTHVYDGHKVGNVVLKIK